MVMSAVSSVSTPGVFVTVMARLRAVSRSTLSTPVPKLAIRRSCGPAWEITARSIRSVTVGTSTSATFNGLGELRLGHRRVVGIETRIEQFAHARFDDVGQLARDDDDWLLHRAGHISSTGGRSLVLRKRASRVERRASDPKTGIWSTFPSRVHILQRERVLGSGVSNRRSCP